MRLEMTFLTRIDPTRNIDRFYVVQVLPTLFGEWAVLREWGRRGSPAATAIRDRFRKCWGRYEATCARLDGAMWAIEMAIRDQWWGQYQAWDARFREQQRQPVCYSLIAVQRTTAVAKWLAGLSGAATVLAFGFYVQSYLSILSIKNDCVSLRFVADANSGAAFAARGFLVSGILALAAFAWPTWVGIRRNLLRWYKASKLPQLQPGHEFDGWSDFHVTGRVTIPQCVLVFFWSLFFFGLTCILVSSGIGMKPEGVLAEWHNFELQCLPQPSAQGAS
jgi:predicted DNA-binding WGR domain protein